MQGSGIWYFSTQDCGVCKVVKPQIKEMLKNNFPKLSFQYIDIVKSTEEAACHSVFTVPTLILFLEGKEQNRWSRHFSVEQVRKDIERPYKLLFE